MASTIRLTPPDPEHVADDIPTRAYLHPAPLRDPRQAELRAARSRLESTAETLALYEKALRRWEAADSAAKARLLERTDPVQARVTALLGRLRLPPDTKGIVQNTTVTARLGQALGRATSTPDAPAPGRVRELEWALGAAATLLEEIEAFYAADLAEYRRALAEAGFDPLGG